jgi:hypothetical protein
MLCNFKCSISILSFNMLTDNNKADEETFLLYRIVFKHEKYEKAVLRTCQMYNNILKNDKSG